jgi:hypothetical protein
MKHDRQSLRMPVHLTGYCSARFLDYMFDDLTTNEANNEACPHIHSFCMHPARSLSSESQSSIPRDDSGRMFDARRYAHVHARTLSSRPLSRPTNLIDVGLACPIPLSLVTSAKHVSSQTSAASQDTTSRRLHAGREQHKVETVA